MRRVRLPGTDLSVSPICLGTGGLGAETSAALGYALLDAFVAHGGNFLDTALVYSDWVPGTRSATEKLLGEWMQERGNRSQMVLATKGAHPDLATMHIPRLASDDIAGDVNRSLRNLQTDCIDLYWLHRDDPNTPVSSIIDTLHAQVEAGKIRYFGCSNWTIERIEAARQYAAERGIQGFVANQPMWSLAQPDPAGLVDKTLVALDADGLAYHRRTGMAAIPYSSQAHGFFTKLEARGRAGLSAADDALYYSAGNVRRLERAQELARQRGVTVNVIGLSYLCAQPFVTVPVVGCKRVDQLEDSVQAAEVTLTAEEVTWLDGGERTI